MNVDIMYKLCMNFNVQDALTRTQLFVVSYDSAGVLVYMLPRIYRYVGSEDLFSLMFASKY